MLSEDHFHQFCSECRFCCDSAPCSKCADIRSRSYSQLKVDLNKTGCHLHLCREHTPHDHLFFPAADTEEAQFDHSQCLSSRLDSLELKQKPCCLHPGTYNLLIMKTKNLVQRGLASNDEDAASEQSSNLNCFKPSCECSTFCCKSGNIAFIRLIVPFF